MQRFPGVFMNLAMKKDENNAFGTQMTARDDSMIRMTGKRRVTPQANGVYRRLTWTWKSTGKRCTVPPFWWALWFLGRKNIPPFQLFRSEWKREGPGDGSPLFGGLGFGNPSRTLDMLRLTLQEFWRLVVHDPQPCLLMSRHFCGRVKHVQIHPS